MKQSKLGVISTSRLSGPLSTAFNAHMGIEDVPPQGQEVCSVHHEKPAPVTQRAPNKHMVSTKINVEPEVSNLIEVEGNPEQNSKHTFWTVMLTISPKKRKNVVTTKESGRPEALPTVITVPGASTSCTHETQSQPLIAVMPTSSGETSSARASQEQLSDLSLSLLDQQYCFALSKR
ncbi:hypothetical protein BS17DRAFT_770631 [Gyrodon lividus]|nr:hypothetical protein BS17DRAFT_770631 [Gyrodon lividus]